MATDGRVDFIATASLSAVKSLVRRVPNILTDRNEAGQLVLHRLFADEDHRDTYGSVETIAFLIQQNPASVTVQDRVEGKLPLHYAAAAEQEPVQLVQVLVEAYNGATVVPDSSNYLPLHIAIKAKNFEIASLLVCKNYGPVTGAIVNAENNNTHSQTLLELAFENNAPDSFVRLVLDFVPFSAETMNHAGEYPIYSAIRHGASLEQIRMLLDSYPEAIQSFAEADLRSLPLHLEASYGGRLQVLRLLIERYSHGASIPDARGYLPIHAAMNNRLITVAGLELLHQAYPSGLACVTRQGCTPLHCACSMGDLVHGKVVWLMNQNRSAARMADDDGNCPLHLAAANPECTFDTFRFIVESFPRAAALANICDGNVPLHLAVGDATGNFIPHLLSICPGAACRVNNAGKLPLHVACEENAPIHVIDHLLQTNPGGLDVYDNRGHVPFHLACIFGGNLQTIQCLIANGRGTDLPPTREHANIPILFSACENDAPLDVIMLLVSRSTALFSQRIAV